MSTAHPTAPKITFVGAGSVVFTQGLLADLFAFDELKSAHIALHDIDAERLATARAAAEYIAAERGARPRVTAHADRREALVGADFVINIVQVGMGEATRTDFEVPARYGLRQTIGDTLGVGGIFRALRTFPLLKALGQDIAEVCPDAWLLNYTNPMAMNVQYLAEATGLTRVVGLCHSVFWTVHGLCELLKVPYEEVTYRAAGVNHQAWVLRLEHGGEDLHPRLDALIAEDPQLRRRVRMDMYRRLGHYPTETSEHSSEYVPWYLHHDSEIERLRLPVGAYLGIVDENVAEYERTRDALACGAPLSVEGTMEYAPQIIHSIVTGTPRTVYGNVPNHGLIENLPARGTVEVPCLVDSAGVQPTRAGSLPPQLAALNRAYLSTTDLVVRAAVEDDPRHIRHAAMADPATAATLRVEEIWELCDDMVRAHGDRLQPGCGARSPAEPTAARADWCGPAYGGERGAAPASYRSNRPPARPGVVPGTVDSLPRPRLGPYARPFTGRPSPDRRTGVPAGAGRAGTAHAARRAVRGTDWGHGLPRSTAGSGVTAFSRRADERGGGPPVRACRAPGRRFGPGGHGRAAGERAGHQRGAARAHRGGGERGTPRRPGAGTGRGPAARPRTRTAAPFAVRRYGTGAGSGGEVGLPVRRGRR